MTRRFIMRFMRCNGCSKCNRSNNRKLCATCRTKARTCWMDHTKRRFILGQCVNCDHRRLQDGLRCRACKEKNRVKCLKYMRAHRAAINARRVKDGVCQACGRRPRKNEHTYCHTCLLRIRQRRAGVKFAKKLYKFQILPGWAETPQDT